MKKVWMAFLLTVAMACTVLAPMKEAPGIVANVQAASKVTLNKKTATMPVGKTIQLKISGTKKTVKWASSKKSVASVDQKGKVTAKKQGKAIITAKVNGKKYTCNVTVKEVAKVLVHSCIQITGKQTVYFDPFMLKNETHDADIIFITHDHYDHFSLADIRKVAKSDTLIVMPKSIKKNVSSQLGGSYKCKYVTMNKSEKINGLKVKAIPAYNLSKPYHPKRENYVGYIVTMDQVTYYISGDMDITPESKKVKCDVAFVPVGGYYTMNYKEAASLINQIKPKVAVPTHYGTNVAGTLSDGKNFAKQVNKSIGTRVFIK